MLSCKGLYWCVVLTLPSPGDSEHPRGPGHGRCPPMLYCPLLLGLWPFLLISFPIPTRIRTKESPSVLCNAPLQCLLSNLPSPWFSVGLSPFVWTWKPFCLQVTVLKPWGYPTVSPSPAFCRCSCAPLASPARPWARPPSLFLHCSVSHTHALPHRTREIEGPHQLAARPCEWALGSGSQACCISSSDCAAKWGGVRNTNNSWWLVLFIPERSL